MGVMHLVTPGVDTEHDGRHPTSAYEPHVKNASRWGHNQPNDWAAKVVKGIESDDDVVGPGGPKEALGKLASRGPAALLDLVAGFAFDRDRARHQARRVRGSAELEPSACVYHHSWRDDGLSDHSALRPTWLSPRDRRDNRSRLVSIR